MQVRQVDNRNANTPSNVILQAPPLDGALAGDLSPRSAGRAGVGDLAEPAVADAGAGAGLASRDQEAALLAGLAGLESLGVVGLGSRQGHDGGGQGEDESG